MSSCETASRNDPCCGRGDTAASSVDSRFSCYICFEEVTEPVVTRCGHLYCWPCLFQWLEPGMRYEERASLGMPPSPFCDDSRRVCPVCKSECPLSSIVPVFVRARATVSAPDSEERKEGEDAGIRNENNGEGQQPTTGTQNPTNDESGASGSENDANDANNNTANGLDDSTEITAGGGLRRRRIPNRSPVPNRPSVAHAQQQAPEQPEPASPTVSNRSSPGSSPQMSASNPYRLGGLAPRSPNGHNASLTHGILLSLQRATADYYRNNSGNDDEANRQQQRRIPSLHDLNRNGWGDHEGSQGHSGAGTTIDVNSETTQYLSRLLIMLTSFVIFCFLLV